MYCFLASKSLLERPKDKARKSLRSSLEKRHPYEAIYGFVIGAFSGYWIESLERDARWWRASHAIRACQPTSPGSAPGCH
jgi:hypothetical protein